MKKGVIVSVFALIILISFASAEVGVGISPSKMIIQVEGGKTSIPYELLIFNTGDYNMEISLSVDGEIAGMTKIEPENAIISPEPKPHELPIKNGKTFIVTFKPPATNKDVVYTGSISAVGSPTAGSQFGGGVGVAAQIELRVTPTKSIFARIPKIYYFILAAIIILILIVYLLKKAGLNISFKKK